MWLTLKEVADLIGIHPDTVRDWNREGRWPNAKQDGSGRRTWRVCVADLVAAGDLLASAVAQVETELSARRESKRVQELREQVARLEERLEAASTLAQMRLDEVMFLRAQITQIGTQK